MAHSSRTLMGIKTTIASTIVALFAAFAAPLTPASAHAHAAISVTDVKLTRSDANGNPIASPLRNDDIASFSFTWSAGDAAVSEGESITVGLPEFFGNLDYGRAAALTAQRMGSTVPIGTCAIAKRSLACTFAKGLNALRAQGFVDMKGTISVLLKATSQTAAKSAREARLRVDSGRRDRPSSGCRIPAGELRQSGGSSGSREQNPPVVDQLRLQPRLRETQGQRPGSPAQRQVHGDLLHRPAGPRPGLPKQRQRPMGSLPDVRSRRQGRPAGTAHRLERIRLLDESRELRHERRNPRRTSGHQSQRPMGA